GDHGQAARSPPVRGLAADHRCPAPPSVDDVARGAVRRALRREKEGSEAAEGGEILSRVEAPEEAQFERQLRPKTFDEYVGQEQAVASLRVSVEAAKLRRQGVDPALLYGR